MAIDVEKTRQEAKKILDSFAKALEKVNVEEARVERDCDRRKEDSSGNCKIDREIMMKNAPKTSGDCIEAEKGGWV